MTRARGLFITGTDTGVGKTVIAAALAAWALRQGRPVGVMKPVATGGARRGGRLVSDDALTLRAAAGADDPLTLINPSCYYEPLAPWVAAARARRPVSITGIMRAYRALQRRHGALIVEGAGGLLVPLTRREMMADLARRMGLPVLIVARQKLGTLNHTLLTIACARQHGLRVAGVVLNAAEPASQDRMARLAERTNPRALAQLAGVPVLGLVPHRISSNRYQLSRYLDLRALARHLTRVTRR